MKPISPIDPDVKSCPDCKGWGKTRPEPLYSHFGSKPRIKAEQELKPCEPCQGTGKVKKP